MNYVIIDGRAYDVLVTSLSRSAENLQSENAGSTLTEGAEEILDPIGTRISYAVTFARKDGYERDFDSLWECLIKPYHEGVWIEVVYNQTTIKFKAKFAVSEQGLQHINKKTGKVYWDALTVTCTPVKAQVLPE